MIPEVFMAVMIKIVITFKKGQNTALKLIYKELV
jgi:hypothetical protein